MAKNNTIKNETSERKTYSKKNYKVNFRDGKPVIMKEDRKNNKKNNKLSMKRQIERQHQPIPRTIEDWQGHRGLIEYQMGKDMADDILNLRRGKEKGIDPQKWLCDYVNEQMNLIGYCIKVVIAG